MAAHQHHDGEPEIGSTLSQVRLSMHLGRGMHWIRRQGVIVRARGETWEASYYNGGRLAGYTLTDRRSGPGAPSAALSMAEGAPVGAG